MQLGLDPLPGELSYASGAALKKKKKIHFLLKENESLAVYVNRGSAVCFPSRHLCSDHLELEFNLPSCLVGAEKSECLPFVSFLGTRADHSIDHLYEL